MTSATSCSANSQFCPEGCARAEKGTKNIHQLGTPPALGTASGSIPPPAKHLRRGCTACSTLPGSNPPKLAIRPTLLRTCARCGLYLLAGLGGNLRRQNPHFNPASRFAACSRVVGLGR